MHIHNLEKWKCGLEPKIDNSSAEKKTWFVIILTFLMMIAEIGAGTIFGSMALLADGWHMGTHAAALGIAAFAYWYAREQKNNPKFTFGTGKVNILGGYTSSTVLIIIALLMIAESVQRLMSPIEIHFEEAIVVAILGLVVNLISALMLKEDHHHNEHAHYDHEPHYEDSGSTNDHNLRAAYLHVIADALTSVLAIIALTTGKFFGWVFMDPVMGVVGALVIIKWGIGLAKDTGSILLDSDIKSETYDSIRKTIEADSDNRVVDMHLTKIGSQRMIGIISIATHYPRKVEHYKSLLSGFKNLAHLTVEINACEGDSCIPNTRPQYEMDDA
ncbi:MAG: CDF family Co(II)/Ni(II) efflux transporter DmeF [Desulfobacterales bacterium]